MRLKRSIRKQVTLIFTIILLCSIGLCILLNLFFLKPFYMADKKNSLLLAYEVMNKASTTRTITNDNSYIEINEVCEKDGLIYAISDSSFNVIISSYLFCTWHQKNLCFHLLIRWNFKTRLTRM